MPSALKKAATASVLGGLLLALGLPLSALEPQVEIVAVESCASAETAQKLREELAIRLPDASIFLEGGGEFDESGDTQWTVLWHPKTDGGCTLLVRSDDSERSLNVAPHLDEEEIRFVASRVSWLISIDPDDESGGLFGPTDEELEEERAAQAALEMASETASETAFAVIDRSFAVGSDALRARHAREASALARQTGEEIAAVSEQQAQRVLEERAMLAAERTRQRSSNVKFTLLPGVVLSGRDQDVPNVAVNVIGRNQAFDGVEIGLLNITREYGVGAQLALSGNIMEGSHRGLQLAGFNSAGTLRGAQLAMGFNLVQQDLTGVQLALGFNYASRGRGVQASPFLNTTRHRLTGVQLGALNVADEVVGVQFGLINISRAAAAPIGLINIATDYPPRVWVWFAMPGYNYSAIRTGGKHLRYGFVTGRRHSTTHRTIGMSLGFHIPTNPVFFDLDLVAMAHTHDIGRLFSTGRPVQQLRFTAGWQLHNRFSPIAGLAVTRLHDGDQAFRSAWAYQTSTYALWPEIIVGVRF